MRKIDIQNAVNALGRIPVNKVKSEQIRRILVLGYLSLRRLSRTIEDERAAIFAKLRRDFADEMPDIHALRESGRPVSGHDEYLRAEDCAEQLVREMFQEQYPGDLGIRKISAEDFLESLPGGDYTFEDLAALDGIILE